MKLHLKTRAVLLLACALVIGACGFGVYGAAVQRQNHAALLQESETRTEQLSKALSDLHAGQEDYLAARTSLQDGENAYAVQKDLVRIAGEALEKRRAELAEAETAGTLSGEALDEARSELEQISAEFAAQQKVVTDFENLQAKAAAYEKEKEQARALLEKLKEDSRIRAKIEAGSGPVAAARQALSEETAALQRRFYIALAIFAALGAAAVIVLRRALTGRE